MPLARKTAKKKKVRKAPKPIPYSFVIEGMIELNPQVRPMFGCHAIYVGEKIIFILREKPESRRDNGVWIATTVEHHASLKQDFPMMRSIAIFQQPGKKQGPTGWQVLPASHPEFESAVSHAIDLVRLRDPRIGKIPGVKKRKR